MTNDKIDKLIGRSWTNAETLRRYTITGVNINPGYLNIDVHGAESGELLMHTCAPTNVIEASLALHEPLT